jgi:5-methylcytosine-specific restriction endonuclease McrA
MNKIEYSKLLKDKKWSDKRLEILKRDDFRCTKCSCKDCQLHIHHTIYIQNKKPWEYNNKYLITLCKNCHNQLHKNKKIKTYKKEPNLKKEKGPKYTLSKRDQELQERYDRLKI